MDLNKNTLTDEQIEDISKQLDEVTKGTNLENIYNFPSNQGQETTDPENRESGEIKQMNVLLDPNSGEHKILGLNDDNLDDKETFEEMCERIKNSDIQLEKEPISEEDLVEYISNSSNNSFLGEIGDIDISSDSIKVLLEIVNRKINNEEFNVYKSFPEEIRKMIDKYMSTVQVPINSNQGKQFRNMISEQLINEFITNISIDKSMHDFNKELEELFSKGSSELADTIVGYTEERNKKYREYASEIEDFEKKEKLNEILDSIDEAYNLSGLKEFSKKCKIKKFDLEKPQKIYSSFLRKYSESSYNIYDINIARPILYRNINPKDEEIFTSKDIDAFFICFCKHCMNMSSEDVVQHAYMYYTIYNIVLIDMNKGEKKDISDKLLDNIKEIIFNLRERNNNFI